MALEVDSSFQLNILVKLKSKDIFLKYSSHDHYLARHFGDSLMWRLLQEDTQLSELQLRP